MHLTPEILEQAYELLRVTPPFRRWKLPPAEEVEFHVTKHVDRFADCVDAGHAHVIRVSLAFHTDGLATLLGTMAHEMCHMRQHIAYPQDHSAHGRRFKQLAASVCRHHHLDPKLF